MSAIHFHDWHGKHVYTGRKPVDQAAHAAFPMRLARYAKSLPDPPAALDYSTNIKTLTMEGNSDYGDCVVAAKANEIRVVSATEGPTEIDIADVGTVKYYLTYTGGRDDGCNCLDLLNYQLTHPIDGNELWGFASIPSSNATLVKQAIQHFSTVDLGLNLAAAWGSDPGDVWDVGKGHSYSPGSGGGHGVCACGYDSAGLKIITWAEYVTLTWAALPTYCDELYVPIYAAAVANNGGSNWLKENLPAIIADLKALGVLQGESPRLKAFLATVAQ